MQLKELKSKARLLTPIVRIGKSGINDSLVAEVKKHLKKRNLIKIKVLKSFRKEKLRDVANELAKRTGSELVDSIGFVFVLYKKP